MLCSLHAPAALTITVGRRHLLRGSVDKESASSRQQRDSIQMQGRLFGLMAVGKKAITQMDHKIGGAAVAGVLNLGNVLELVDDGLNDGSFAHQELVAQVHQAVGHVLTQPRDEVESLLKKQLGKRNGDVASVANEFAAQSLDQERNRTAIIHISWSQVTGQQLSPLH